MIDFITLTGIRHIEKGQLCQDYSLSFRSSDLCGIIISDGCSSGGKTDLGARLLCLKTKKLLESDASLVSQPSSLEDLLCQYVKENDLQLEAKDYLATLQILAVTQTHVHYLCFGDGSFGFTAKDGSEWVTSIEYSNNAPYYLNYQINTDLGQKWVFSEKAQREIITQSRSGPSELFKKQLTLKQECTYDKDHSCLKNTYFYTKLEKTDLIQFFIASDGFTSFENCSTEQVWDQLLGYKSTVGQFVQRRLAAQSRKWLKSLDQGPTDDLSLGVMLLTELETQNGQ